MKKFFKSLALVLALVLVIGTVPAAAATTTVAGSYTGYVGKTKLVRNLVSGFDKDTMTVTFKSSDTSVVKKYSSNKVVFVAAGKADLTVTVKDADKKTVASKKVAVTVKKYATDATVTATPDKTEVKVNDTVTVKAGVVGEDSMKRTVVVKDADGTAVDVTKVDTRTFSFVAAKETTYTVTVSAKGDGKTVTATADVVAKEDALKAVAVKQIADNKIVITYNKDAKDVKYTNEDIYYILGEDNKVPFSLISKTEIKEKDVTLTFYTSFSADKEYFVATGDEPLSFVGQGKALKDVVEIVLEPINVYKGENNTIKYKYLNVNGIDISNAVTAGNTNIPTFEVLSDYAYLSTDNDSKAAVYATEAGKELTLKAKLVVGYSEVDGSAIEKTAEITLSTSNAPDWEFTGNIIYAIKDSAASYIKDTATTDGSFALADTANLQVLLQQKKGNDYRYVNMETFGITKVVAANGNVALVGTAQGTGASFKGYTISGIAEGTTSVMLYKNDANGQPTVFVTSFPVTVKAARKLDHFTVTPNKTNLNVAATAGDSIDLCIVAYDQYNAVLSAQRLTALGTSFTVKQVDGNAAASGITITQTAATMQNAEINGTYYTAQATLSRSNVTDAAANKASQAKTAYFTVESGAIKKNLSINVMETTAVNSRALDLNKTSLNTGYQIASTAWNTNVATATLQINTTYNGFKVGTENFVTLSAVPTSTSTPSAFGVVTATTTAVYGVLAKKTVNGVTSTLALNETNITKNADSVVLKNINGANQLGKGTYTFTVYKYEKLTTTGTPVINILGQKTLTVTDTQNQPTITVKYDNLNENARSVGDCFEFSYTDKNGQKIVCTAVSFDTVTAATNDVFVKTATITLEDCFDGSGNTTDNNITVNVNKLLTYK